MKFTKLISFCLLVFSLKIDAQETNKIEQVESGLIMPKTYPAGTTKPTDIQTQLENYKIAGASVAVIDNYQIDWSKGYGFRDKNSSESVTTQTLFQCASIGKVITTLAVLKMVEEGKVTFDSKVNDLLSEWKLDHGTFEETQVTLRHLLTHSAGLTDGYGFPGYGPQDQIPTLAMILSGEEPSNVKKQLEVRSVPGTREKYSGAGYVIIQMLIEEVTGQTFASYVSNTIFDLIGMNNTTYDNKPDQNLGKEIAVGYDGKGNALKNRKYNIYPEKAAAGPWTTAEDLARLVIEIQKSYNGDGLIDRGSLKELLTPQINNKGLGVNIKGLKPEAFWHAGNNLGYTGVLYGLITSGKGAIVLTNSDRGEKFVQEFITSVANAYDWPVMQSYEILDNPSLDAFTGKYENKDGQVLYIGTDKSGVFLRREKPKGKIRLQRIEENRYTVNDAQDYLAISFEENENGIMKLIFVQSPNVNLELEKVE